MCELNSCVTYHLFQDLLPLKISLNTSLSSLNYLNSCRIHQVTYNDHPIEINIKTEENKKKSYGLKMVWNSPCKIAATGKMALLSTVMIPGMC